MQMFTSNPSNAQLAELYQRHVAMVRNRVARLLPASDIADDIVQDVFLDFVRFARKNEKDAMGLLYHITTCVCIKRIDKHKRERGKLDVDASALALVDERLGDVEDRVLFRKLLAYVKEDLATVALYYHVEGMSQDEIARITNLSQREVSRRLETFAKRALKYVGTNGPSVKAVPDKKEQVAHGRP